MSASSILGFDAASTMAILRDLSPLECVIQRRGAGTVDPEDARIPGAWAVVARTLPDGLLSIYTPCYFGPLAAPGEVPVVAGAYLTDRYQLYLPYAPDVLQSDRLALVRHSATFEPLYPLGDQLTLNIVKIAHTAFVLTIVDLEEVRGAAQT